MLGVDLEEGVAAVVVSDGDAGTGADVDADVGIPGCDTEAAPVRGVLRRLLLAFRLLSFVC